MPETGKGKTGPARIVAVTRRLELHHPWTISRGSAAFKENVFVAYHRDGLCGYGEAGHLTAAGQSAAATRTAIETLRPLYQQGDPWTFFELEEDAGRLAPEAGPARAALDTALMDWLGKRLGLGLHRWFGLDPERTPLTSFSIGLDAPEALEAKIREAEAWPVLKIKLGGGDDRAVVEQVRRFTAKPLRVDVNEGWRDREQAIRDIEWLAKRGIELVEQPLPRTMLEESAWLKARSPLPLIADEAVRGAADLPAAVGAFHGVNVKLMKAGGLLAAWQTLLAARSCGLECMLGCMIESSAGIAAAVQLQPLVRWADLDGNRLLKDDPFDGLQLREGRWQMPPDSGIGVLPGRELGEALA